MKHLLKKMYSMLIITICIVTSLFFGSCGQKENIQSFYDKVVESQQCVDIVADDIYSYWYDAIYDDKYSGDINKAILYAHLNNSENLLLS